MGTGKILVWGLLGYLFSLVDDDPLNADQLLGTGTGFYAMELLLRCLTIACFYLAAREASGRVRPSLGTLALMGVAFFWTSADDLRYFLGLGFGIGGPLEYPTILLLQGASLVFFLLAVRSGESRVQNLQWCAIHQ